ncbi:phage/plasmid replication protein, II/X family, partial [Ochrobactrum sp. SFR4]|uniref:phage/plasmid replication protein, II/X family n=1 Tax=Ochrobactrum sp. SFR4 TaxID=2717368 RepID=UPI001C8B8246
AIRTVERGYMEFSGNPSKFMQGHNLFGTDDLVGLMNDVLEKICTSLNLEPSTEDKISWLYGDYTISRIDLTAMRELPTFTDV